MLSNEEKVNKNAALNAPNDVGLPEIPPKAEEDE